MAHIRYVPPDQLADSDRVNDADHIIQIHSIHPEVMRLHYDLYREVMYGRSPLSRREREMIAFRVSSINQCHY